MDKSLVITKNNWRNYCYGVGDFNPIHWSDREARKLSERVERLDLKEAIAPGMFIASHIQDSEPISIVGNISFKGVVYDGDKLVIAKINSNGGYDYVFTREGETVCEVKRVRNDSTLSPAPERLRKPVHTFQVNNRCICQYLKSIGREPSCQDTPEMFFASLSAPALLNYGEATGFVGMHHSQSFYAHRPLSEVSDLSVLIAEKKIGRVSRTYDLQWVGGGEVYASGESKVLPLSLKSE